VIVDVRRALVIATLVVLAALAVGVPERRVVVIVAVDLCRMVVLVRLVTHHALLHGACLLHFGYLRLAPESSAALAKASAGSPSGGGLQPPHIRALKAVAGLA
jgi:hypothetical protein